MQRAARIARVAPVECGQAPLWLACGLALSQLAAGDRKLDPQTAAKLYLALVGVAVAGIGLLVTILLWGARVRRSLRQRPRTQTYPRDAWAQKPLVPPENGAPATHD